MGRCPNPDLEQLCFLGGGTGGVPWGTSAGFPLSLPAPELPPPLDLPPPPPLDTDDLGLPPLPPPDFGPEEPSWVPAAYLEKGALTPGTRGSPPPPILMN